MKNKLSVHSYESFGTVDGPGIRFVLFLNACPLRCLYCHNPDTWLYKEDYLKDVEEVANEVLKYTAFSANGAITVSGGEPLLQATSLIELFKILKKKNVHTCIDTSGYTKLTDDVKELLELTDLVLLDIKQINGDMHKVLTNVENKPILEFARYLDSINKKVWIRYVLVPGYTDDLEDINNLKVFIDSLSNVEKVEVLPYHKMAVDKYSELGLKYPLLGIDEPTKELTLKVHEILNKK